MNRIADIEHVGQAIWLDDISRAWLTPKGFLSDLVAKHHAYGLTTNPSIFAKALQSDELYAQNLANAKGQDASTLLWSVMKADIAKACDVFRPLYDKSDGLHGYVSIEVNPTKAHDAQGTIEDGIALWKELAKPNLMIKVPATTSGLEAIERLTEAGINVNATLLFSVERYEEVLHAWMRGLLARAEAGKSIDQVHSVASFFISRMDVLVDKRIGDTHPDLVGTAAVANAIAAYGKLMTFTQQPEWARLERFGANLQRLLWASTSVKNPDFPDTKYIDELIAPHTVNTVPLATIEAVIDHGATADAITGHEHDCAALDALAGAGVDLAQAAQELEDAGIAAFIKDYEGALATVEQAMAGK